VRSIVTTTDRNWTAAPRADGLEIIVQGPVTVRVHVEMEALRERLHRENLSASEEQRITGILRAVGGNRSAPDVLTEARGSAKVPMRSPQDHESTTQHRGGR